MLKQRFSDNAKQMRNSEIREFFKLTEKPEIISFAGGFPSKECLPSEEIREVSSRLLMEAEEEMLQYSATEGQKDLREYIVDFMAQKKIDVGIENIMITSGAQQGLDLVSKIFINPGDKVITEAPSYVGGLGAIRNYQGDIISIKVDENGLRLDLLEEKLKELTKRGQSVKFIYLVADFNNPTGLSLAIERRKELLKLAKKYEFLILEDDPYSDLRYKGIEKPNIKSLDKEDHVIYLGSFSKIFIPGIRVGWVIAAEEIIQKLILAKQSTDLCSNSMGQKLVTTCGREGIIDDQIKKLRQLYCSRRDMMMKSLKEYFPSEVRWTEPEGGFYTWVQLPTFLNSKDLLFKAIEENVAYVSGTAFSNNQGQNAFRLSFSQPTLDEIEEGIYRLGKIIKKELNSSRVRNQRCIK
ncbi:PLP-dependent aminotransferase family protein [Sporohalobacter salinus]|uniref:aminotransferase-like domain-containing protein n=1 Tax=Sporohalobacter salinus TaxID=1494606 RepID=UPI00195FBEF4|nr:PLP-dependent aminotransferase family protein [Sporohalobacter salinus]MBM7624021.1 2-aminoadipate transaminase [Sporohalobacter salinus]